MIPVKLIGDFPGGKDIKVDLFCVPVTGVVIELDLWGESYQDRHLKSWKRFKVLSVVHQVYCDQSTGHFVSVFLESL